MGCEVYDDNMEKEGEFGSDMKGSDNYGGKGDYSGNYGDKPEGENNDDMKSRKRRSCNGGPPEQCQWYIDMYGDGEDDNDEQPEDEDMDMSGGMSGDMDGKDNKWKENGADSAWV